MTTSEAVRLSDGSDVERRLSSAAYGVLQRWKAELVTELSIAPSILAADAARLGAEIAEVAPAVSR